MLAYQVFVGSIYLSSAFFFAAFMGGLSTGSYRTITYKRTSRIRHYYGIQFILAIFSLILPFMVNIIDYVSGYVIFIQVVFFFLVFALAFGIGFEFNLAAELQRKGFSAISGNIYSTDLAGSALGAFLTSLFLLPALGLIYTCMILAGLYFISGSVTCSSRNNGFFG